MLSTDDDKTKMTNLILELRDPLINYLLTKVAPLEKKESLEKLVLIHSVFCNTLPDEFKAERITLLMKRIIFGEEKKAQEVLELLPHLLLNKRGKITDYSGKQIENLTPFEAALAAGDTNMLNMMTPYFDQLKNGQEIMQWQFKQIFPDKKKESRIFPDAEGGLAGHLKRQKENVFDFSEIIAAIDTAKNKPDELQDALDKVGARITNEAGEKPRDQWTLTEKLNHFREKFMQKSRAEVIFNQEHLQKAFTIYDEKFGGWNWDQRDLFWRQVIGFVQRFLPACDAQAFAQGLYDLVEDNATFQRSFDFTLDDGSFYPVDFNSCSSLGFDCAARALWAPLGGLEKRMGAQEAFAYKTYIKQKNGAWRTYADQPCAYTTHCVIL